jgi:hypothetical protein
VGLVKTRRLAAMQKQQRAKAGMKPLMKGGTGKGLLHIPRGRKPRRDAGAGHGTVLI